MKILFILFIVFSFSAAAGPICIDGKIKVVEGKNETLVEDRYCFDSVLRTITSTRKCPDDKECFINLPGPHYLKGKDAVNICKFLKGVQQKIEFWDKQNWLKTTRCLFQDGSYIDISSLKLKVRFVD